MNGSKLTSTTASSPKSKEDQVVNGHDEKENNPFAESMWMENEEDFNRQVEEELQEQEFLDRCFQEMLEDEDQDWFVPSRELPQGVVEQLHGLSVGDGHSSKDILNKSNLNPDAKEFVPGVKYTVLIWNTGDDSKLCATPAFPICNPVVLVVRLPWYISTILHQQSCAHPRPSRGLPTSNCLYKGFSSKDSVKEPASVY